MTKHKIQKKGLLRSWFISFAWMSVRMPLPVLVLGIVIIATLGWQFSRLAPGEFTFTNFEIKGSESDASRILIQKYFPQSAPSLVIAFHKNSGALDEQEIAETLAPLKKNFSDVTVLLPQDNPASAISADKKTAYAVIQFPRLSSDTLRGNVEEIRQTIELNAPLNNLEVYVTGGYAIGHDIDVFNEQDLARAEQSALPFVMVILGVVFGGLIAMCIPLAVGGLAVILSLAILFGVAQVADVSNYVFNVVTMLGLGLGIDYSLFFLSRFREELRRGKGRHAALISALAWSSEVIFYSGITVAIGFVSLLFIPEPFFRSMGMGGIAVVISALAVTFLVLPPVLVLAGEKINWPPFLYRVSTRFTGGRFWARLSRFVMRRTGFVLISTLLLLALLIAPALKIAPVLPGVTSLPLSADSRAGYEALQKSFGGGLFTPGTIVIDTGAQNGIFAKETVAGMLTLEDRLSKREEVHEVSGISRAFRGIGASDIEALLNKSPSLPEVDNLKKNLTGSSEGQVAVIRFTLNHDGYTRKAQDFVTYVRNELIPSIPELSNTNTLVGGAAASGKDFNDRIYGIFPFLISLMLFLTFIVLAFFLKSVLLPLKAIIMNLFATGAAYGALVLLFQMGWGQTIFGPATGALASVTPILLFAFLFGISMDYEIFLLSRIREEYEKTGNTAEAVARGLTATGGLITNAALIMVVVFGAFSFASVVIIKEIGFGLAFAILLDATIIRALLVPSFMKLAGKWNWWWPLGHE